MLAGVVLNYEQVGNSWGSGKEENTKPKLPTDKKTNDAWKESHDAEYPN